MKRKQRTSKTRTLAAAELDALHDAGVDLSAHVDLGKAIRPGRAVQRVNVDFPVDLLREIDQEARRDTAWALETYATEVDGVDEDKPHAYIRIFGVLNRLVIQQDAAYLLCSERSARRKPLRDLPPQALGRS